MKRAGVKGLLKRLVFAAMALSAWMGSGCGQKLAEGGDATETGNARIAGRIVTEEGTPVAGAQVTVLASDWNPSRGVAVPDSQKDTTDSEGRYRFTRLVSGDYNLQVLDPESLNRTAVYGISLSTDSVIVPKDTLHLPGSISVPLPETQDSGIGWVYIPGTSFRARVDSEIRIAGFIRLDSVPAGTAPSLVYTKGEPASRAILLAEKVAVHKAEITYVSAFATWGNSARLLLNTSASGVSIAKEQRDFPLLVRLAAPGFDFSQASAGGADLRFSKPDGTPLFREIETWDAQAGHAEIWVRVDTVHANSPGQSINMHWGKSATSDVKPRRPVFDTLTGFAGVWHLAEEAADTTANGLHKDATGAGSDGNDRVTATSRAGAIGYGRGIDSGDYVEAPKVSNGLKLAMSFTLSAWYRTDGKGMGTAGGEMANVGDNYGLRVYKDSSLHLWYWPPVPPTAVKEDWYYISVKGPDFIDGRWHWVTGSFDGKVLRLYVDGKEVASAPAADVVGFLFPMNLTLGKHGNGKRDYEYRGDLDEVQIHSAVRGSDWIKLTYENQKPGSLFPALAVP